MTFLPPKTTDNDEATLALLEIVALLKLQNLYHEIITDTELDESDVQEE